MMISRRNIAKVKIAAYLLLPVVLLVLPATFFDNNSTVCLSKTLFNTTCPGCGISRGIMHLLHFDFEGAYHYNQYAFIVLPLLIFGWATDLRRELKRSGFIPLKEKHS
jgi:hypothetical protein